MIAAAVLATQLVALSPPIVAHAPAEVPIDDRVPVHGRAVVGQAPRTVRLQERAAPGEWHLVATERTRRTGRFAFSVSSGHALTERTLRLVAAPSHGLPRVRTAPFVVDIVMRMGSSAGDQQIRGG
ncbi:MAG TPA: hypothetical protein VFT70_08385 [Nocardioides sp.]|nr:hypothetical protein [Nocardioides sp.]